MLSTAAIFWTGLAICGCLVMIVRLTAALRRERSGRDRVMPAALLVLFTVSALTFIANACAQRVLAAPNGVPLFAFLVPLAAFVFAVVAFATYIELLRQERASAAWAVAPGKIVHATVAVQRDGNNGEITWYRPEIRFAYRIGEREFRSSSWKRGWAALHATMSSARDVLVKYPTGHNVAVYYDPVRPHKSVIEPNRHIGIPAPLVFSAMFGLSGLLSVWALASLC